MPSISSRTICTTFWCTRQPAGSQLHKPAPVWRTMPARTSSLWLSASASAGASRSVGMKARLSRVTAAGDYRRVSCRRQFDLREKGSPMAYEVPPLPYDYNALEPTIDEQTMQLHHDKHHQAYVDKANGALEGTDLDGKPIDEILKDLSQVPEDKRGVVRNNGGGHYNHSLFWESMGASKGGAPSGDLASAIDDAFGSFDAFKEQFEAAGVGQFGSGWAWLVLDGGQLKVRSTANQDNPVSDGQVPLLGNDVWEHAYYLKYQNKRPDYLKAWWDVVDWDKVPERDDAAK